MATSVSLKVILHSKKYADGTQPVMLQCIVSTPLGSTWKRKTICKVAAKFFDKKKGRIKDTYLNSVLLNGDIVKAYTLAETRILEMKRLGIPVTPAAVLADDEVHVKPVGLLEHARSYVETRRMKGQAGTAAKYASHVNQMELFMAGADVPLKDISEKWVLRFVDWLREGGATTDKKTRAVKSPNTLHRRMKFVHGIFLDAIKRGITTNDPFSLLQFKAVRTRKPKLTQQQVEALENVILDDERENDARNTFLLQLYAYGARIGDAISWQKHHVTQRADGYYIDYISGKSDDVLSVRLPAKAVPIIEHYLFQPGAYLLPWMQNYQPRPDLSTIEQNRRYAKQLESKTQLVNKALKRVAEKAGITLNLTTHIARHTFATLADQRVSDKRKISAALGHSKFSTTEIYLNDLRQSEVNDAMDDIWK